MCFKKIYRFSKLQNQNRTNDSSISASQTEPLSETCKLDLGGHATKEECRAPMTHAKDDELCSEPPQIDGARKQAKEGKLKRQSEKQTEQKPKAKGRKRGRDTTAHPSSHPRQKCETPQQATPNQPIKHPQNHHKRLSRVPPGLQSTNPE